MPIQTAGVQYGGLNQDMNVKDPRRNQFYYDASNITLLFNRELSRNVVSNERGNQLLVSLPNVHVSNVSNNVLTHPSALTYNDAIADSGNIIETLPYSGGWDDTFITGTTESITNQIILGATMMKDHFIVISTDQEDDGHLMVWDITYTDDLTATIALVFMALDVGMSQASMITKILGIYEATDIQKVYWVDGINQLRSVNIAHATPFTIGGKTIDSCPAWNYHPISITDSAQEGGQWSDGAGMVQYGYRLHTKHGAVTKLSPLSHQVPVTKGGYGVASGEKGTVTIDLSIPLDEAFEYVEVYRFHHDDGGNTKCHLVVRETIAGSSIAFTDAGDSTSIVQETDILTLLTAPAGPFFPKTFEYKDNRIFVGNVSSSTLSLDAYDARAYSFDSTGDADVLDVDGSAEHTITSSNWTTEPGDESDLINSSNSLDPGDTGWEKYRYQSDGSTLGAEGPSVTIDYDGAEINVNYYRTAHFYKNAGYKRNELYRFGIQFYDKWGNHLYVKWISDLRMPSLNRFDDSDAGPHTVSTSIMFDGTNLRHLWPKFSVGDLNTLPDNVYAFRIVRVERTPDDRRIKTQGYMNTTLYSWSGRFSADYRRTYMPMYHLRHFNQNAPLEGGAYGAKDLYQASSVNSEIVSGTGQYKNNDYYYTFTCPELTYLPSTITPDSDDSVQLVAGARADTNGYYRSAESAGGSSDDTYESLSSWFDIYDSNLPHSSNSFQDELNGLGGSYSTTKTYHGPLRYHWILHQAALTASTLVHDTAVIFEDLDAIEVINGTAAHEIQGNTFRNYMNVWSSLKLLADGDESWRLIQRFQADKWVFTSGASMEASMTTHPTILNWGNITYRVFPIVDYWVNKDNVTPYGGDGYQNRLQNKYIPCSDLTVITNSSHGNIRAYGGDTFTTLYKWLDSDYDDTDSSMDPEWFNHRDYANVPEYTKPGADLGSFTGTDGTYYSISSKAYCELPIESYLNLNLTDSKQSINTHKKAEATITKVPNYNPVYHRQDAYLTFQEKPYNFVEQTEDGIVTRYSDNHSPGAWTDALMHFRAGNANNVDNRYGSITAFHIFKENLFVIQEYGIGYWLISPMAQTASGSGLISLGTGAILADYKVLSDKYGSTFKWGSVTGSQGIYVLDYSKKKIIQVTDTDTPVSDLKGLHSLLLDLPKEIDDDLQTEGEGIRLSYDQLTHNIYFSIFYDDPGGVGQGQGA